MADWNSYQKKSFTTFAVVLGILLLVNFFSTTQFFRWDLTKEKRYTLSKSTKDLLKELDEPIYVEVYLEGKDLPAGIKKLKNSTRELLNEFRALSGGMLDYKFIDVFAIDDDAKREELEEALMKKGLYPTNLEVQEDFGFSENLIYPGAVFSRGDRSVAIKILENQMAYSTQDVLNNSYNFLEFKLANAVKKMELERPYRVVFLEGHGEVTTAKLSDLGQYLAQQDFLVRRINLAKQSLLGSEIDILIIPKPQQPFPEIQKFEIDQYIMRGGKVIWMIDKAVADLDSFRTAPNYLAVDRQLNIDDQLFKYGVRINTNLVQDILSNPIPLTEGQGDGSQTKLFPWVFHPIVNANNDHPIGKKLDPIALEFASSLDTIKVLGVKKTVLLSTSEYGRKSATPVPLDLGIARVEPLPEYFQEPFISLGVLLEGKFKSLYENRVSKEFKDLLKEGEGHFNTQFISESIPTQQIVIGDGDIGVNDVDPSGAPLPLGYYRYTKQTFANRDFLVNCVEYLLDDNGLISTRNKESQMQLLDSVLVDERKGMWQFLNIVVPLIFMLCVGGFIRYNRKRKYEQAT